MSRRMVHCSPTHKRHQSLVLNSTTPSLAAPFSIKSLNQNARLILFAFEPAIRCIRNRLNHQTTLPYRQWNGYNHHLNRPHIVHPSLGPHCHDSSTPPNFISFAPRRRRHRHPIRRLLPQHWPTFCRRRLYVLLFGPKESNPDLSQLFSTTLGARFRSYCDLLRHVQRNSLQRILLLRRLWGDHGDV